MTAPKKIPSNLLDSYTMGGRMPVVDWYRDDSYQADKPIVFTKEQVEKLVGHAKKKQRAYYGETDSWLYQAIDDHQLELGDLVAIVGSRRPWYEAIAISYGCHCTTIEYNKIVSEHPMIRTLTVEEYDASPEKFDSVLSISSVEHDGLGRYGDPLDPYGDFKAIKKLASMLNPGGLIFLAIPIGADTLAWNVHRIYGKHRLMLLLQEFTVVASYGFDQSLLFKPTNYGKDYVQPVFVLKPLPTTSVARHETPVHSS